VFGNAIGEYRRAGGKRRRTWNDEGRELLMVVSNMFFFHNIWDNLSHWLIFFRGVETTNQRTVDDVVDDDDVNKVSACQCYFAWQGGWGSENEHLSKKQSIGEAKSITKCITKTSTKHAGRPADSKFGELKMGPDQISQWTLGWLVQVNFPTISHLLLI
jgi:hypothetical protein